MIRVTIFSFFIIGAVNSAEFVSKRWDESQYRRDMAACQGEGHMCILDLMSTKIIAMRACARDFSVCGSPEVCRCAMPCVRECKRRTMWSTNQRCSCVSGDPNIHI